MSDAQEAELRLTRDEVEARWGRGRITLRPRPEGRTLGLPPRAAGVLAQLGLPDAVPVLFTASQPRRIVDEAPAGLADAVQFGRIWHEEFALLVMPDERVVARHQTGEVTPVNTGLDRYLEFLLRASIVYEAVHAVDTGRLAAADYLVLVERERAAMRGADPEALSDGWWWTGVVDEFDMV